MIIYYIARPLFALLFFLFYRIQVFGNKSLTKEGAVITPNHASYYDGIVVQLSIKGPVYHFVKASLFQSKFSNFLMRSIHCIPVAKRKNNLSSIKEATDLVKKGNKLVIYPEGTRTPDGNLQPGQSGAGMLVISLGVPAIPVYVANTYKIFNRHMKIPKLFKKIPVVFGSPIYFDDIRKDSSLTNKEAYQKAVDRIMDRIAHLKTWYENGCVGEAP
ncbi:lysophospholipid acyltransferase family protein [Chlamydiifrater phoenicopteri]|uniref:lysophospholipid acyltransferase family protein n=1 Tax=Chlamydiifrater phoenicopteri TaxID=2681469 RepID=UPI001BCDBB1C|nr:lysophospholipid acyltransferase family protein [Chlamydiifrater phoenicopteri]